MNENEIERIALATNALRPDWPLASIRTLIRTKLIQRTRRDVAVALAWVACESQTKTPARVLEAGPWWQTTNESTVPRPPKVEEACHDCGKRRETCGCPPPTERSPIVTEHLRSLRAIKAATDAKLCGHKVPRANCLLDHDDTEESA
jgi:hypothetical protein